jgi:uncharacterized membrane protein YphA (DoxX/SURF4 family)
MTIPAMTKQHLAPWAILDLILRLVLSAIFLVSGVAKLTEPQSFAVIIEAYGIVPELLVLPVALVLPGLEIVSAVGLVMDQRGSLELMTVLILIFMTVLAYGIYLGLDVDCGCFGPEDPEAEAFHGLRRALYRDMAMMLGVFFIYTRRYLTKMRSWAPGQI